MVDVYPAAHDGHMNETILFGYAHLSDDCMQFNKGFLYRSYPIHTNPYNYTIIDGYMQTFIAIKTATLAISTQN